MAYLECRKHKRKTPEAMKFELNMISNLYKLYEQINDGSYVIGSSKCFIVVRPNCREVFAASFIDRIVHHVITMRLEPLLDRYFISNVFNCRRNKGTLCGGKNLYRVINSANPDYYIVKYDIRGFFMHIDKDILWKKIYHFTNTHYKGRDKRILLWLCKLVVYNNPTLNCRFKSPAWLWDRLPKGKSLFDTPEGIGLPIGNITSQIFANLYFAEFDLRMYQKYGDNYGRYVDDFYCISYKEDLMKDKPLLKYELKKLNLELHPSKFYLQPVSKGAKFIGTVSLPGRFYVSNRTVGNFWQKISYFNHMIDKDPTVSFRKRQDFIASMNSYLGYLKHEDAFNIICRNLKLIDKRWFECTYIDKTMYKICIKPMFKPKEISIRNTRLYLKAA
jgi:hypothetical protein